MSTQELTKDFLETKLVGEGLSPYELAEQLGTYASKIRRAAVKAGIPLKNRSDAQKNSLKTGRREHPMEGKGHSEETKLQISEKRAEAHSTASEEDKAATSAKLKKHWDERDPALIAVMRDRAVKALRKTADEGSKLEKFLYTEVGKHYIVEYHKTNLLAHEQLELDLFLPQLKTAIEIDGPSHFLPIHGEEVLARHKRADAQKSGLLSSSGFCIIRIKHLRKSLSKKYLRDTLNAVLDELKKIEQNFPVEGRRYIVIDLG